MWDVAIKTAFVILNCFSRKVNVKIAQLCLTLWNPMDCSLPGSSVHGILQARILEWVAFPFSRGSSQPKDRTQVSCIAGRFLTVWATREAQEYWGRIEAIPSLTDLPDLGIEPGSAALQADSLPAEPPGNSAHITLVLCALKAVLCEEFLTNQCICERASQDSGGTFITLDKERVIFWEKRKCGERGTYCCLQKLEGLQSGEKWELLKGQNWSWGQHVGIFLKEGQMSWMIPGLATAWWWHLLLQASKQRLLVCVRAWWCSQATLHDRSTVSVCPACAGAVAVWARWRPWASLSSACRVSSVMSDSGLSGSQPARLLCPWGFPDKDTGVGCCALLKMQGILPTQGSDPCPVSCVGGRALRQSCIFVLCCSHLRVSTGTAISHFRGQETVA